MGLTCKRAENRKKLELLNYSQKESSVRSFKKPIAAISILGYLAKKAFLPDFLEMHYGGGYCFDRSLSRLLARSAKRQKKRKQSPCPIIVLIYRVCLNYTAGC
jgi:hypothetical protein